MASGSRVALVVRVARAEELRRVHVAFLNYSIAEHATFLAMAFYALQRGGPGAVGLVTALQLVPTVVLTPFSSYAGDRFRPRLALAVGYAVQCASMAATALAMATGGTAPAYVMGAIAATAISFTRPVMGSLLPTITHAPSDLVAANVVCGIIEQVGLFVGPLLSGVIMLTGDPWLVFAYGAVSTGIGAVAVVTLRGENDERPVPPTGREAVAQLAGGFVAIVREPALRILMIVVVAAGLVRGVGDVVYVTFADERLGGGGSAAGYLAVVYGVGGLVAAASVTTLMASATITRPFLVAGVASAAALGSLSVVAGYATSSPGFALLGAGDALLVIMTAIAVQRITPTDTLARVFGVVEGVQMGFCAVGAAAVSALSSAWSLGAAFSTMAAVVGLVVLIAVALMRHRKIVLPIADEQIVRRLLEDPVFSPLPAPIIDRLAREAERRTIASGTCVVREGDHGDRYYLIESGEVEVTEGDHITGRLGATSSFGEVALLHDVPRTASVTAVGEVRLLAVRREEFLEAVTAHPRSLGAATSASARWLDRR